MADQTFTIEAPDGRKIKIQAPDQATALQGAQQWAAANPLRQAADVQAALSSGQERFSQLPPAEQDVVARAETTGASAGRALARGVPFVGAWLDEANARTNALLPGVLGGSQAPEYGQRVEDNAAYERALDRTFDKDYPASGTALQVAGGVAGTVAAAPAVAGAGAAQTVGRTILGLGAKTLPGAMGRGAIAGTLQGAAAGAGDAQGGFVDRGMGAIGGGVIGGTAGALLPAAWEGIRGTGAAIINRVLGRNQTPLTALSGGAQRYVGQISDPATVQRIQGDLATLGPDAMLADVSPEWQAVARGAAARPGSRGTVVDAMATRDAGKNQRLAADLDAALGPAPVPSQVQAEIAGRQAALGPEYGRVFANARAVDTSALAADLDATMVDARGPAQRAMRQVREMLNIPGTNELDPHPPALLSTRQAIDGMLATEADPNVVRILTAARNRVDGELAAKVPGIKDVDAQFAELARQGEGVTRGGQVLNSGKEAIRPQELGQEIADAAQPQGTMVGPSAVPMRIAQGTRAELDRVAGTSANDPMALQRTVKGEGDWNRTKLGQIFGEETAADALNAIDREVRFRQTHNRVTGGSDTGMTAGFKSFLDRAEAPMLGGALPEMTAFGTAVSGAKAIGAMLTGAMGKERANRYATELARAAIATGVTRDEFVSALQAAGVQQQAISRALEMATRVGLVGAREAPSFLMPQARETR